MWPKQDARKTNNDHEILLERSAWTRSGFLVQWKTTGGFSAGEALNFIDIFEDQGHNRANNCVDKILDHSDLNKGSQSEDPSD